MGKYIFEESIGRTTMEISRKTGKLMEQKFTTAGFQISSMEWTSLAYLNRYGALSQKELTRPISRNKVAVKRVLDKLEEKKLIVRIVSDQDKRVNKLQLTQKGKELYKKLLPLTEEVISQALQNIEEKELKIVIKNLEKISSNLGDI